MASNSTRVVLFDYIKVIMKAFIIITHVSLITAEMRASFFFPLWIDQAVPMFWLISAYLFASGFSGRRSAKVTDELKSNLLNPRIMRIVKPYVIIIVLLLMLGAHRSSLTAIAHGLLNWEVSSDLGYASSGFSAAIITLCGGQGPGGYYIPCLIQMYFLLPLLCAQYKRFKFATTCAALLACAICEALTVSGLIDEKVYRLLILRYLPYLMAGIIAWDYFKEHKSTARKPTILVSLACFAVGLLYLLAINYLGFPTLSAASFKNTSSLAALYACSLFFLLLTLCDTEKNNYQNRLTSVVVELSKAALHIYIFQMFWFYYMNIRIADMSLASAIFASLLVCFCVGYIWWKAEQQVTARLKACMDNRSDDELVEKRI